MTTTSVSPLVLPGSDALREEVSADAQGALEAARALHAEARDVGLALELARRLGDSAPRAGSARWLSTLATIASADLSVARVVEPHVDALQILAELPGRRPDVPADATWGVFAAEGPGMRVEATETDAGWRLSGRKPWCSLAGDVSHALITAHAGEDRRLFAIAMADATVVDAPWPSRGLTRVVSGPIDLDDVAATPVGDPGWYLRRPGFWLGGIGVAAVWWGGAVALGRALVTAAGKREPDQVAQMLIGRVDRTLHAAGCVLAGAAADLDAGAPGATGYATALRVRRTVAECAETVLAAVGHGLGPAPLALDEEHARRVADLQVYVRQDHAERDDAALARELLAHNDLPWSWHA